MHNKATVILSVVLVAILAISIFLGFETVNQEQLSHRFFLGVEMAYANATFNDVKELVDKVKDYTNLFVIGSPEISLNQSLLNMTCDYIYNAGLHFIVLFTDTTQYSLDNLPFEWIPIAKQKYGDKFWAVYRFDEPGGRVLDHAKDAVINETYYSKPEYDVLAKAYAANLYPLISYYLYPSPRVVTADYSLYWFDYNAGYTSVLAEFGNNDSREINIALCRGAARANGKDWGSIVTWTYTDTPYIESSEKLYQDLKLAYRAGAKYAVVFDHPRNESYPYGILTPNHLAAINDFWNYVRNNPQDYAVDSSEVAYVLPAYYGYGFRSAADHVWMFPPDNLSAKVWNDAKILLNKYGSRFDIIYDDARDFPALRSRYSELFFWNETMTID